MIFDNFDTQIQCEELPGYAEWLAENYVLENIINDEEWEEYHND